MKLLLNMLLWIATRVLRVGQWLCDWCENQYTEKDWYWECAHGAGRILWLAHDDFWIGKQPIFWD